MKIYQLSNQTPCQMMGYVIQAESGEVIVIDGGATGNSEELIRTIRKAGTHISAWFITHPHTDHYNAAFDVIEFYHDITIDHIYFNEMPDDYAEECPGENREIRLMNFRTRHWYIPHEELTLGQEFRFGDLSVKVLGIANKGFRDDYVNNLSCVLKFVDDSFSMLFLGDLGVKGGEILLKNYRDEVVCDGVQLAHHGQDGVEGDVYEAIRPKYAFWPTPRWLYNNEAYPNGDPGAKAGIFDTPRTIGWMKSLGVTNVFSFDYSTVFDTLTKMNVKY